MFTRWGRIVVRHPKIVLLGSILTFIAALATLLSVTPQFSTEGFIGKDAESSQVLSTLEQRFNQSPNTIVFLFDTHAPVTDTTRTAIDRILAPIAHNPRVQRLDTAWSGSDGLISKDGTSTYAVAHLIPGPFPPNSELNEIRESVRTAAKGAGFDVSFGGMPMTAQSINTASAEGIKKAEMISIPVTLIILVLVFGSLVASALPLVIGGFAIMAAIAVMTWWSTQGFQSIFAANVVTMLGLGLGIDYSLFMIRRYRDELRTSSVEQALVRTMETVGKTILFAGITVMLGLGATQFFPLPTLQSLGQAGMVVTFAAMLFGLTLLPALLAMLGPWVNRFHVGPRLTLTGESEGGVWHRLADMVMARPVIVLAVSLVLMLTLASPIRDLNLTPGGSDMLPPRSEERVTAQRLKADFPADDSDVIIMTVRTPGKDIASPDGMTTMTSLSDRIAKVNGVTGVSSVASIQYPWARWDGSVSSLPAEAQAVFRQTVNGDTALVTISSTGHDTSSNRQIVQALRDVSTPDVQVKVGGMPGAQVDTLDGIRQGIVPAALFVAVGAYIILFLTFGSVLLPLKAILMGALSIAGSMGMIVWVFQHGHMEGLLDFVSTGSIVAMSPVLIACILFGLSMDYEVLMLSRIQEEYGRTGDNRRSVATGLAETGQVISGAATIMVIVFGGFLMADIAMIKSMGFGLAFAVLIDATVVRGLLVPSTMRLLGEWNWWAPRPIQLAIRRMGLSHA